MGYAQDKAERDFYRQQLDQLTRANYSGRYGMGGAVDYARDTTPGGLARQYPRRGQEFQYGQSANEQQLTEFMRQQGAPSMQNRSFQGNTVVQNKPAVAPPAAPVYRGRKTVKKRESNLGFASGGANPGLVPYNAATSNRQAQLTNAANTKSVQDAESDLDKFFREAEEKIEEANSANKSRRDDIMQRLDDKYNRVMDRIDNFGEAARSDLEERAAESLGNIQANLSARGLGNSTIMASFIQRNKRDLAREQQRLSEAVDTRTMNADVQMTDQQTGFLERINENAPDYGQLMELSARYGRGNDGQGFREPEEIPQEAPQAPPVQNLPTKQAIQRMAPQAPQAAPQAVQGNQIDPSLPPGATRTVRNADGSSTVFTGPQQQQQQGGGGLPGAVAAGRRTPMFTGDMGVGNFLQGIRNSQTPLQYWQDGREYHERPEKTYDRPYYKPGATDLNLPPDQGGLDLSGETVGDFFRNNQTQVPGFGPVPPMAHGPSNKPPWVDPNPFFTLPDAGDNVGDAFFLNAPAPQLEDRPYRGPGIDPNRSMRPQPGYAPIGGQPPVDQSSPGTEAAIRYNKKQDYLDWADNERAQLGRPLEDRFPDRNSLHPNAPSGIDARRDFPGSGSNSGSYSSSESMPKRPSYFETGMYVNTPDAMKDYDHYLRGNFGY